MKFISIFIMSFVIGFSVNAEQIGTASWYGGKFHGKKTASGQIFNTHHLTAAHRTIKLGTKVKVTNLHNHKSVIVLINDRGPYVKSRCIDLSHAAKEVLAMGGTAKVSIKVLD
jgi:rare lipoprotein A